MTPGRFREAARQWPTGVAVLTTLDTDGAPHGTTVNSVTTVSLDPPFLLVSLGSASRALTHVLTGGSFALTVLGHDQEDLAHRFAKRDRPVGHDGFTGVATTPGSHTGCPVLHGSVGHFECAVESIQTVADHCLVVASVISCAATGPNPPLLFTNGAFTSPGITP